MTTNSSEKSFETYIDRLKQTEADPALTDRICCAIGEKRKNDLPPYAWPALHCAFVLGVVGALLLAFHLSNCYIENKPTGAVVCSPELYLHPFVDHQAKI